MLKKRKPSDHPLYNVKWVDRDKLVANDYNPNHVAPSELALLEQSILEDGWTQPLVASSKMVKVNGKKFWPIIDGFHRWMTSGKTTIRNLTGGLVPVVFLDKAPADRIFSTVRHNRARGTHGILPMSQLVRTLKDACGVDDATIRRRMGMDQQEIVRMYDKGTLAERLTRGVTGFSQGWVPTNDPKAVKRMIWNDIWFGEE